MEGHRVRPFSDSANVTCRGYSKPLQRAMTDFGADDSFLGAVKKLQEHYHVTVPLSSERIITKKHAKIIRQTEADPKETYKQPAKKQLISELDGCMLPITKRLTAEEIEKKKKNIGDKINKESPTIETKHSTQSKPLLLENKPKEVEHNQAKEAQKKQIPLTEAGSSNSKPQQKDDMRKYKNHIYREARLSLAREHDSKKPMFAAMIGDVDEVGEQLLHCAKKVGYGSNTKVHGVGDGATWIVNQIEKKFGNNASYLIDFCHLCDYISAAGPGCAPKENISAWIETQKKRMKENKADEVLAELLKHKEPPNTPDEQAPVRACYRYINNRLNQLDYKTAIEKELPIGSGEIESGNGYVIQARLKISGAWWSEDCANDMLALRTCRANDEWERYWNMKVA